MASKMTVRIDGSTAARTVIAEIYLYEEIHPIKATSSSLSYYNNLSNSAAYNNHLLVQLRYHK